MDARYNNSFMDARYNNSLMDARYNNSLMDARYNNSFMDARYNNSFMDARINNSLMDARYNNSFMDARINNSLASTQTMNFDSKSVMEYMQTEFIKIRREFSDEIGKMHIDFSDLREFLVSKMDEIDDLKTNVLFLENKIKMLEDSIQPIEW